MPDYLDHYYTPVGSFGLTLYGLVPMTANPLPLCSLIPFLPWPADLVDIATCSCGFDALPSSLVAADSWLVWFACLG